MRALNKYIMGFCVVCLSLQSTEGYSGQSLQLSESTRQVASFKNRPIRVQGQAQVTLKADLMSVNLSMAATGTTMNEIIQNLQARRDELSEKTGSGPLNVIGTEISSLNIRQQRGNAPGYQGEVQMTIQISGVGDPLSAIAQIADERVTRVNNLRYGFSEEMMKQHDLCDTALSDARNRALKIAEAAGHKLGKLIEHQCNDSYARQRGYSSQASRDVIVSATAVYERAE